MSPQKMFHRSATFPKYLQSGHWLLVKAFCRRSMTQAALLLHIYWRVACFRRIWKSMPMPIRKKTWHMKIPSEFHSELLNFRRPNATCYEDYKGMECSCSDTDSLAPCIEQEYFPDEHLDVDDSSQQPLSDIPSTMPSGWAKWLELYHQFAASWKMPTMVMHSLTGSFQSLMKSCKLMQWVANGCLSIRPVWSYRSKFGFSFFCRQQISCWQTVYHIVIFDSCFRRCLYRRLWGSCLLPGPLLWPTFHFGIIFAKSRLAPENVKTVPRLELIAALLWVAVAKKLVISFGAIPNQMIFWSDQRWAGLEAKDPSKLLRETGSLK